MGAIGQPQDGTEGLPSARGPPRRRPCGTSGSAVSIPSPAPRAQAPLRVRVLNAPSPERSHATPSPTPTVSIRLPIIAVTRFSFLTLSKAPILILSLITPSLSLPVSPTLTPKPHSDLTPTSLAPISRPVIPVLFAPSSLGAPFVDHWWHWPLPGLGHKWREGGEGRERRGGLLGSRPAPPGSRGVPACTLPRPWSTSFSLVRSSIRRRSAPASVPSACPIPVSCLPLQFLLGTAGRIFVRSMFPVLKCGWGGGGWIFVGSYGKESCPGN